MTGTATETVGTTDERFVTRLVDVDFGYGPTTPVLENFSLGVEREQVVVLLGPSGCGKTTILKLLAGFIFPDRGSIEFQGSPLNSVNTGVGYMTQNDTLLPWRTTRKNIALPLQLRGMPRDEVNQRVDEYLKLTQLEEAESRYPSQLSGGMKRRALLSRSLIYKPAMLLMDEPFGALDAQLREKMHQEFIKTVQSLRQSVLFITHDISESIIIGDRIVLLGQRGSIIDDLVVPFPKDREVQEILVSDEYYETEARLRRGLRQTQPSGTGATT